MTDARIPFLMYHAIQPLGNPQPPAGTTDPVYTVRLPEFERQLAHLKKSGFQTITLLEYLTWRRGGFSLPKKPILLSFDDGDPSHIEWVLPRLAQYQFRGVFAVVTDWIGTPKSLSVDQLRILSSAGMEVISHGKEHRPLVELTPAAIRQELEGSRVQLEAWLGKPVRALAIPRGYLNPRVLQTAYESGFEAILTSRPGENSKDSDPYNLARSAVKAACDLEDFIQLAQGHAGRRLVEMGGYLIRRGAQRTMGVKGYDRLRSLLLNA